MLLYIKRNGHVVPYIMYEFIGEDVLVLYGDGKTVLDSYILAAESMHAKYVAKSKELLNPEELLPAIYDTSHGLLGHDSLQKYGIPVEILIYATNPVEIFPDVKWIKENLGNI